MALGVGGQSPDAIEVSCRLASGTVNVNTTNTDTALTFDAHVSGRAFVVDYVLLTNSSTSLTTATGGVFSATGGSGAIMATEALSPLVTPKDFMQRYVASASTATGALAQNGTALNTTLYFRNSTAQGAAATADVYVFGRIIPG